MSQQYHSLELQITWKPELKGFRVNDEGVTFDPNLLLPYPGPRPEILFGRMRIQRQSLQMLTTHPDGDSVVRQAVGHETAGLMYDLAYELRKGSVEHKMSEVLFAAAKYAHQELMRP